MGRTRRDDPRDVGKGMIGCRRIARERVELAYSWDTDSDREMEAGGNGDKVE